MEDGRGARRGARRADRFDLRRVDFRALGQAAAPARLARAATIDRGSAVRRPSRPPPLTPFGFNLHGGGDCLPGLARAEQRCRRTLSRFDSPRLFAGVGGRRPDRHGQPHLLGSSVADWRSRPSWAVGNAGVLDRALFRAEDTYPYGLVGGQVSTRRTTQEDAGLPCLRRDRQRPSLCATGPRADTRQWPARRASPARPGRGRR